MKQETRHIPVTSEAGNGFDPIEWKGEKKDPYNIEVRSSVLEARQLFLIEFAHRYLWNPKDETSCCTAPFAIGMECGQYKLDLFGMLEFAKKIGCQVVQPSGNQIDLALAAIDSQYRLKVWNIFADAKMALTTISIHVDTYSAIAILNNKKAGMFTPKEISEKIKSAEETSKTHLEKLAYMIIGAAQLGIRALHLFWGDPHDMSAYPWAPETEGDVQAMRQKFAEVVRPLIDLATKLGVMLCHEIHYGTIAMNADDFIEVWELLGRPANFCLGFDPSHFWHGETWWQAMDKLRKAGIKVIIAHAKNFITFLGRPILGHQRDDRKGGFSFTTLNNPAGGVSMIDYLGFLTISGILEFWHGIGLPAPVHVEAENPFWKINGVSRQGVKYLLEITDGLELPQGHFTEAMRR